MMVGKRYRIFFYCLMFLFSAGLVQAQDLTVAGPVVDAGSGAPLPGVNIAVKGTTTGTSSDADGEFELTLTSPKDTLVISYIGYKTQNIPVAGQESLTIELQAQAIAGEELVVVGYGSQKEENVTGSISSVSSDELESRPVTNVTSALQGTMAGVTVTQPSGQAGGGGSNINIRGICTLAKSNMPGVSVDI